jgi:sugar phosphate isomerase/epimerase
MANQDFMGTLKKVADIGYKGVEVDTLRGFPATEVRRMLDDLGMVASSAHVRLPTSANLQETVDTAKTVGYDTVIVNSGPGDFATMDAIKARSNQLREAIELLKPRGLHLGYHNHWYEFDIVDGRYGIDWLLEMTPGLESQVDVYWAANFGNVGSAKVAEFIEKHRSRITFLHLKDGPLVKGEPMVAVGSGKMNIPACVFAADPKVLKWVVVELDACATDMLKAVENSYRFITDSGLAEGNR